MLWIRKKVSWVAGLVVGVFILWGIGTAVSLNSAHVDSAGLLFGRKISHQDYQEAIQAVTRQAVLAHGDQFREKTQGGVLENQAWERLLLLKEAENRKIQVSDEEIVQELGGAPLFQRNGQFDRQIYESIVRYALGTNARNFEEELRQTLMIGKLIDQVLEKAVVTPEEVQAEFQKREESIQIQFLLIPHQAAAQEITDAVRQNPEFLNRAAKHWALKLTTSDFFKRTSTIPELGQAGSTLEPFFLLEPGQVGGPIHSQRGWLVGKLEKKEPAKEENFEAQKETIEKNLVTQKRLQVYFEWYSDLHRRANLQKNELPPARPEDSEPGRTPAIPLAPNGSASKTN